MRSKGLGQHHTARYIVLYSVFFPTRSEPAEMSNWGQGGRTDILVYIKRHQIKSRIVPLGYRMYVYLKFAHLQNDLEAMESLKHDFRPYTHSEGEYRRINQKPSNNHNTYDQGLCMENEMVIKRYGQEGQVRGANNRLYCNFFRREFHSKNDSHNIFENVYMAQIHNNIVF